MISTGPKNKDWRWQLENLLCSVEALDGLLSLSPGECAAFDPDTMRLPVAVTPYFADLLRKLGSGHPLRRCVLPDQREGLVRLDEESDPLGEETHQPVPGLVHTYPDKVLLLVTGQCATYCRYCMRHRRAGLNAATSQQREDALQYIRDHSGIRDVLLSGGDPLMLQDDELDLLLSELGAIPHVEIIRVGTRMPVVLPQRITDNLASILRKHAPLWTVIHVIHPDELTPEVEAACDRLVDAGVPLLSQSVLLAGVNDQLAVLKTMFRKLLRMRIKPYYLHLCDAAAGTAHFRTDPQIGIDLVRGLHGYISGPAVPTLMVDAPGGGGKVPLTPSYVDSIEQNGWRIRNYQGEVYEYRTPERVDAQDS
jgi:lysine 2,3-aminomutase